MPVYPYQDVIAWNNFEGMTNGATLTTANSGGASGTAFSGVQIVGGTIVATTTNPIHDTKSLALTSAGICNFRWDNALMGDQPRLCGVIHFRIPTWPTAYTPFLEAKDEDGGNLAFRLKISSAGNLRLTDSVDAAVFSTTTGLSLDTDYRIEYDINCTTGAYQVRWALKDSTTYIDTRSGTGAFGTQVGQVVYGRTLTPELTIVFDTVAISTTPLGKRAVPSASSKPYVIAANPGGFTAVGGTSVGVLRDASNATYLLSPEAPANASYTETMEPMNQTGKYSHTTTAAMQDPSPAIQCTVVIKNGATTLVTDTWALTNTPVDRITTTPADVAAGVELTVITTTNQL